MEYVLHIVVLVCVYTMLAASLDLLVGHTGLLSLSQAAFFGLGAYTSALLAVRSGVSFPIGMGAGMVVATIASLLVSMPSLRLRDDYFVLATFGFQMIVFSVFNNWVGLTRGPLGIAGIPPPIIFGWTVQTGISLAVLAIGMSFLSYVILARIITSPFGRVLHAIREDEILLATVGRNPLRFKVIAFAISAAFAAAAGCLYGHYMSFIDPSSFTVMESILVLSMVIVGGAGSPWGPLIGAAILVTTPELLRFLGLPSSTAAHLRLIIYGILLILMTMARPRGFVGRYGFGR